MASRISCKVCTLGQPGALGTGRWGSIQDHSASDKSVWYALLMLGTLPSHLLKAPFRTVSRRRILGSWTRVLLLLRRVYFFFILHDLQAFDLLEGEAHYAALLALVLDVDGLIVIVDEDLLDKPAVVVEPLCPLGDILVLHLLGLLAHLRLLLPSTVSFYPKVAPCIPQRGFSRKLASPESSSPIHRRPLRSWLGGSQRSEQLLLPSRVARWVPWPTLCSYPYSPECVEEKFCELRHNGVLEKFVS